MSGPLPDNALLTWLQDEANDEFLDLDALAGMYSYFSAEADNPLESIKTDDRHHCFLIYQKNSSGSLVASILHHLAQYPSHMGQDTAYDGNWYMTEDQPVAGSQITYELPTSLFDRVAEVQSYTPDRIQREIANNPDLQVITAIVDDDNLDDLTRITTRRGMWIPNCYAALCLGGDLGPIEVWNRIYGVMLQKGHTAVCSPLLHYLQYHLRGAVLSNDAAFGHTDLLQPRVNAEFLRHHFSILSHLVVNAPNAPSGGSTSSTGPFGMSPQQFQEFVAAMRSGHTAPAPAAPGTSNASVGTVDKRWSVNLTTLLKLTQVTDVNSLPPVWSSLAKGPRKEERNILQAALDDHAYTPTAATNAKLTVTKELLSTVVNLSFWPGDFDLLTEGLHPYRTVYVSAAKQAQDQATLQTYDSLARDGTLRLEDVQLFQLVLKSNWPTDYLQLDTSIRLFHNLLSVLLPASHPLYISYDGMLRTWKGMHILFAEYFGRDRARPAQFLRSLQLRIGVYWQSMAGALPAAALLQPPPNFTELLMSVSIQTWIPPSMPGQAPPLGGLTAGSIPGNPFTPLPSNPPPAAPPPATPTSSAPPGGNRDGNPPPRQYEVRNSNVIPEVAAAMEGRVFQIRTLFGRGRPPPQHTDGRPMCCTYHLRGRCSNTCNRAYSHVTLSTQEKEVLCTFVNDRIVTPNIGRGNASPGTGAGNSS